MKKFNFKEKFLKIALATVTVGFIMGSVFSAPTKTEAATEPTGHGNTSTGTVMLADKLLSGGINDPIAVRDGSNVYYAPMDYVYYGSDFDGNPLLWRVLDNDADNTGEGGAMFLFSEQTIDTFSTFSSSSDDTIYKYYSLIADVYEPGGSIHFNSFYQSGKFEFTYEYSYMGTNEPALRSFVPKKAFGQFYYGNYISADAKSNGVTDVHELSALRPITKVDESSDAFGMSYGDTYWTSDTIYGEDGVPYTGVILNNAYIFPLSVDELERYVANYSGAPGLATTSSTGQANSGWWLRTAYQTPLSMWQDENTERKYVYVGYVDNSGKVGIVDVNSGTVGGRYGINLELDRITFGEMVEENVWRLGIIDPFYYNNTDVQFNAWVIDAKYVENEDGELALQYKIGYNNAVGRDRVNYYDENGLEEYISVMIKDKDGNVKYYATVDETPIVEKYNQLIENDGVAEFTLPADVSFNENLGDEMVIFWERRGNNANNTSFTSNFVEIECAHSDFEPHNCISPAQCNLCGEEFGWSNFSNHLYTREFAGTPESPKHGIICETPGCAKEGLAIFEEDCVVVANCIEVFEACSCGNSYLDESAHIFENPDDPEYVVTGYCELSNHHFQPARIDLSGNYIIENVANFLWLGQQVNAGNSFEGKTVIVDTRVLDFAELKERGIKFFDIGTSDRVSFQGTFDGRGVVIKNLKIEHSEQAGFFAYTLNATIKNIIFENVEIIGGYYGGIVASRSTHTTFENIEVVSVEIGGIVSDTIGGLNSGIVCQSYGRTTISNCLVYGAVVGGEYAPSMAGQYLPLVAYGDATIINSYCLANEADDNGGRTLEQMASGEIAYLLGSGWGQKLSGSKIDVCPRKGSSHFTVFKIPACGGVGEAYGNVADGREAHKVTVFIEEDGFTWDGTICYVTMGCEKCDYTTTVTLTAEDGTVDIVDHGSGVRYTFTAIVDATNGYFTNENVIIAKRIEDVTAVEPVTKDFDGEYIYADDLLTNTKMNYSGFSTYSDAFAYFVDSVTGEYRGIQVASAGVYDLVVDGMNAYEGQKYIYKEIVKINKISLTLDVKVQSKPYDGSNKINYEIGFIEDVEISTDWLIVNVADPSGAEMGIYEVKVSLRYDRGYEDYYVNPDYLDDPYTNYYYDYDNPYYSYDMFKDSIDLVWSDTVTVEITPQRQVNIAVNGLWAENFDQDASEYVFTYGDNIPAPEVSDFTFDEGSVISFEWYERKYENYWDETLVRIPGQPTDAGEYVLRVVASATENLVKSHIDVSFVINKKVLTVQFVIPEDAEFVDYYDDKYYIFSVTQYPEFVLDGVSKDEWESLGISFDGWYRTEVDNYYRYDGGYPTVEGKYWITVDINITTPFGVTSNYEIDDSTSCYIYISESEEIVIHDAEYIYDGNAKNIEMIVPSSWTEDDYTVTIKNESGETVSEILNIGRYTVSVTDKNGATVTATVIIRREIRVYVKELSVELSGDGFVAFDLMGLVFEAGYSPAIGHTLTDLKYEIDTENGIIYIVGWTVMAGDEDVSDMYAVTSEIRGWSHEVGELNVAHVFDNSCDSSCNMCGLERAVPRHKGGVATCSNQAICDVCGEYYGELNSNHHESETEIFVPSAIDVMMHDLVHSCCGEIIRTENHSIETAATCLEQATCTICRKDGYRFGPLDPNNHACDEFTYYQNPTDGDKHDKYHACCGVYVATEEHSGGEATCQNGEICQYCSTEYGEIDAHNHANPKDHTEANCKERAKCSECGEYYGELAPENHESDAIVKLPSATDKDNHDIAHSCCGKVIGTEAHTGGVATCNSGKICSECGGEYGETDPENHASENYKCYEDPSDASHHVRARECCGIDATFEEHTSSNGNCLEPLKCIECGLEYAEHGQHSYDNECSNVCNVCGEPTRGLKFHLDADSNGKCDHCSIEVGADDLAKIETEGGCNSSVGIGAVAILVMTLGVGLLVFKKKEK